MLSTSHELVQKCDNFIQIYSTYSEHFISQTQGNVQLVERVHNFQILSRFAIVRRQLYEFLETLFTCIYILLSIYDFTFLKINFELKRIRGIFLRGLFPLQLLPSHRFITYNVYFHKIYKVNSERKKKVFSPIHHQITNKTRIHKM